MAEERFILTQAGYDRLQQELAALQQEHAQLVDRLDVDDEDPDDLDEMEPATFDVITTRERIDERIGNIRFVLERAEVRTEDPDPKRVDPGERVVVWDLQAKRERTFDVLSGPEVRVTYTVNDGGRDVSVDSPVGQALVGRAIGDVVEVDVPEGKARYAVRRIESIPDGGGSEQSNQTTEPRRLDTLR